MVSKGNDDNRSAIVERMLERSGTTYAEQAGITLRDQPAPLYRLLVLSVPLSTRIKADIGVAAATELHRSGMGTPERMLAASWQDRVDALGRAHYKRYDESTATALGDGAEMLRESYRGDLRALRRGADRDPDRIRSLLTDFSGWVRWVRRSSAGKPKLSSPSCARRWTARPSTARAAWGYRPNQPISPSWSRRAAGTVGGGSGAGIPGLQPLQGGLGEMAEHEPPDYPPRMGDSRPTLEDLGSCLVSRVADRGRGSAWPLPESASPY